MDAIKKDIESIKNITGKIVVFFTAVLLLAACKENYMPKRTGYFRIDFPAERTFLRYEQPSCPFTFEYPSYGVLQKEAENQDELTNHPCWFVAFPEYKGKIYLSYTAIDANNTLDKLVRDSYKLTFKHTVKADYIDETVIQEKIPVSQELCMMWAAMRPAVCSFMSPTAAAISSEVRSISSRRRMPTPSRRR